MNQCIQNAEDMKNVFNCTFNNWMANSWPTLDQKIGESLAENNRQNWKTGVKSCQHTHDTGRLFRVIAKMSGKKQRIPPNRPITLNNKQVTSDEKIAASFPKQFTTIVPHTPVTISGTQLPLERHPKLLGVTFEPHFTIHIHARVLKEQTTERLKNLKALAGTDWGQKKKNKQSLWLTKRLYARKSPTLPQSIFWISPRTPAVRSK